MADLVKNKCISSEQQRPKSIWVNTGNIYSAKLEWLPFSGTLINLCKLLMVDQNTLDMPVVRACRYADTPILVIADMPIFSFERISCLPIADMPILKKKYCRCRYKYRHALSQVASGFGMDGKCHGILMSLATKKLCIFFWHTVQNLTTPAHPKTERFLLSQGRDIFVFYRPRPICPFSLNSQKEAVLQAELIPLKRCTV